MPSVNLIPADLLVQRCKRRRVRVWGVVVVVAWLLAAAPAMRELSASYRLSTERAALAAVSAKLETTRATCRESSDNLRLLKEEIARAEKLRFKRAWTALISAIAKAMPPSVWLTAIETDPPRPAQLTGAISAVNKDQDQGGQGAQLTPRGYYALVGKAGPQRVLLEGKALGLEDIYVFISALSDLRIFESTGLRSVREAVVEDVKVTHFLLECRW